MGATLLKRRHVLLGRDRCQGAGERGQYLRSIHGVSYEGELYKGSTRIFVSTDDGTLKEIMARQRG
jgi:hypothetical protein